ncbi:hypothetical protein C8A03DRAFT_16591 [Achaetomium macrosporum]|uniref:Uncharacterized protein n=1 Tax=Achaetomium macrosporum TaxID=79813 RepID=A0AAN7C891_9PEZI|nr:hypothetical protein C8A03DRAFT_16591 [Achaetomium macrosporum]
MEGVYNTIIIIFCRSITRGAGALNFFSHAAELTICFTHCTVNILGVRLRWGKQQKFRAEFARFLGTIRENTYWIDSEANVALHILSYDLTNRGHREILASMSAMRTPSATGSPATGVTASNASYRMITHLANPSFFGRQEELRRCCQVWKLGNSPRNCPLGLLRQHFMLLAVGGALLSLGYEVLGKMVSISHPFNF